ncbi:hypothetical protein [Nesterenkonia pannonica]|uniref:hypothetical protein n=1 Tax=Nesterenkonia pannonica TaxID=1548602 RepID=UPI0021644FE0|nr:hypothetical protein [Nesterenkonia pannonica]
MQRTPAQPEAAPPAPAQSEPAHSVPAEEVASAPVVPSEPAADYDDTSTQAYPAVAAQPAAIPPAPHQTPDTGRRLPDGGAPWFPWRQ